MECGTLNYKKVWYGVLFVMMSNPFVSGVTFRTSITADGTTSDDTNGNTFTLAIGATAAVTITTDAFAVSGTVSPVLVLQLTDTTSPISCILSVGDSTCTPTCIAGTATCTKGNPSGILQVQFNLASIPATYNLASLTFTLSGSTVGTWDYGTKQLAVSGCPLTFFEGAEIIAATSETCGSSCVGTFNCTDRARYTCDQFTSTCQANAQWDDVVAGCTLCTAACSMERGSIVAAVFGCINGVLLLIWTIIYIKHVTCDHFRASWHLAFGAIGWVLYVIVLSVSLATKPDGGIAGIFFGCINTVIMIPAFISISTAKLPTDAILRMNLPTGDVAAYLTLVSKEDANKYEKETIRQWNSPSGVVAVHLASMSNEYVEKYPEKVVLGWKSPTGVVKIRLALVSEEQAKNCQEEDLRLWNSSADVIRVCLTLEEEKDRLK